MKEGEETKEERKKGVNMAGMKGREEEVRTTSERSQGGRGSDK